MQKERHGRRQCRPLIVPPVPAVKDSRILILTAGFGEGHNSAAKHLAVAMEQAGATVMVADPCAEAAPWLNERLRDFYRLVTTHAPSIWYRIYLSTDRQDFSKERLPFMRKPESHLAEVIEDFRPTAIVNTYPLYPYFCDRILKKWGPCPVFTVITDSIEINAVWRRAPSDYFFVTDETTKADLVEQGMAAEKIQSFGFAVHPRFSQLQPLAADGGIDPFRVLYFPTAKKPYVRRVMRALLAADERVQLTVVLGKNVRKLYRRAKQVADEAADRVKLKGWTRKVPELLASHHVVIGKAGGATVHEAIAATTPMLVHHLVPGQEEGNLALLRQIGGGALTEEDEEITSAIQVMLQDDGQRWREMKRALESHARPEASREISSFIFENS